MTLRSKCSLYILGPVFVMLAVSFGQSAVSATQVVQSTRQAQLDQMVKIIHSSVNAYHNRALSRAELVASFPGVAEALAKRDVAKLKELCGEPMRIQHARYGGEQAHFFTEDNKTVLRLEDDDLKDDSVEESRPLVVAGNSRKEPLFGLEVSRTGPAIFGVAPLFVKGKPVGLFEVGMSMHAVVESRKRDYGMECSFMFSESLLREFATHRAGHTTPDHLVDGFANLHSTDWQLTKSVLEGKYLEEVHESTTYMATRAGVDYGVAIVPLLDFKSQRCGYMIGTQSFASYAKDSKKRLGLLLFGYFSGFILVAGAVQVVLNGMLIGPMHALHELMEGHEEEREHLNAMAGQQNELGQLITSCLKRTPLPPEEPQP